MKTVDEFKDGQVLLVDKPLNWSSFQVVNKIRWSIRQKFKLKKIKVGHAGTLDPLATGLLILCTGKFTKDLEGYQGQEKEYTGTITVGGTTPSYDLESEINEYFEYKHITEEQIRETTAQFIGDIDQKPPMFSAIKVDGRRLYKMARKGDVVAVPSRIVHVDTFEITNIDLPNIDFRVVCSKGTYIRSLAYDFGLALNSGAHLSKLRRTKIGNFNVDDAIDPIEFVDGLLGVQN